MNMHHVNDHSYYITQWMTQYLNICFTQRYIYSENSINRAVTNFSSRRGIVKSSQGTKKVWCYSRRLLLSGGGGGGGAVVRWRLRV